MSEIIKLNFPENVRKRPGMYLPHMTHMVTEIIDNSLDEHVAGHADSIHVAYYKEINTICVEDNGRGIPTSPNADGIPQVVLAATELHAGK